MSEQASPLLPPSEGQNVGEEDVFNYTSNLESPFRTSAFEFLECFPSEQRDSESIEDAEKDFLQYVQSIPMESAVSDSNDETPMYLVCSTPPMPPRVSSAAAPKVGFDHLDNLCKLMEQLGDLKEQNSRLQKRVQYLEDLKILQEMYQGLPDKKIESCELLHEEKSSTQSMARHASEKSVMKEKEEKKRVKSKGSRSRKGKHRERSKSIGTEDMHEMMAAQSAKPKSTWSKVKGAFKWEKGAEGAMAEGMVSGIEVKTEQALRRTLPPEGLDPSPTSQQDSSSLSSDDDLMLINDSGNWEAGLARIGLYRDESQEVDVPYLLVSDEEDKGRRFSLETPANPQSPEEVEKRGKSLDREDGDKYTKSHEKEATRKRKTKPHLSITVPREDPPPIRPPRNKHTPGDPTPKMSYLGEPKPHGGKQGSPAASPPLQRRSKWIKVKKVFLSGSRREDEMENKSQPTSPCFHDHSFTYDRIMHEDGRYDLEVDDKCWQAEHRNNVSQIPGEHRGSILGGDVQRNFEELQKKFSQEVSKKLHGWEIIKGGGKTSTEEPQKISQEFNKKLREWERMKAGGKLDDHKKAPNEKVQEFSKNVQELERMKELKIDDSQKLSEEFNRKMQEWSKIKTGKGPEEHHKRYLPHDFTKKLQEWERMKVLQQRLTHDYHQAPKKLPQEFNKKLQEWEKIKSAKVHVSPKMDRKAYSPKIKKAKAKTAKVENKAGKGKEKELQWLEKELNKVERDKQRLEREREKYLDRAERLQKMRDAMQQEGKQEVLIKTSTGEFRFEGISEKFTKKLYEWEEKKKIAPEASTIALLDPNYVPSKKGEENQNFNERSRVGSINLTRSKSEGSVVDLINMSENSLPSTQSLDVKSETVSPQITATSKARSDPDLSRESSKRSIEHPAKKEIVLVDSMESVPDEIQKMDTDQHYSHLLEENINLLDQLSKKQYMCKKLESQISTLDTRMSVMAKKRLETIDSQQHPMIEGSEFEKLEKRIAELEECSSKLVTEKEQLEMAFQAHSEHQSKLAQDLVGKMEQLQEAHVASLNEEYGDGHEDAKRRRHIDPTVMKVTQLSTELLKQARDLEEELNDRNKLIRNLHMELLDRDMSAIKLQTELQKAENRRPHVDRRNPKHHRSWSSIEAIPLSSPVNEESGSEVGRSLEIKPLSLSQLFTLDTSLPVDLTQKVQELKLELMKLWDGGSGETPSCSRSGSFVSKESPGNMKEQKTVEMETQTCFANSREHSEEGNTSASFVLKLRRSRSRSSSHHASESEDEYVAYRPRRIEESSDAVKSEQSFDEEVTTYVLNLGRIRRATRSRSRSSGSCSRSPSIQSYEDRSPPRRTPSKESLYEPWIVRDYSTLYRKQDNLSSDDLEPKDTSAEGGVELRIYEDGDNQGGSSMSSSLSSSVDAPSRGAAVDVREKLGLRKIVEEDKTSRSSSSRSSSLEKYETRIPRRIVKRQGSLKARRISDSQVEYDDYSSFLDDSSIAFESTFSRTVYDDKRLSEGEPRDSDTPNESIESEGTSHGNEVPWRRMAFIDQKCSNLNTEDDVSLTSMNLQGAQRYVLISASSSQTLDASDETYNVIVPTTRKIFSAISSDSQNTVTDANPVDDTERIESSPVPDVPWRRKRNICPPTSLIDTSEKTMELDDLESSSIQSEVSSVTASCGAVTPTSPTSSLQLSLAESNDNDFDDTAPSTVRLIIGKCGKDRSKSLVSQNNYPDLRIVSTPKWTGSLSRRTYNKQETYSESTLSITSHESTTTTQRPTPPLRHCHMPVPIQKSSSASYEIPKVTLTVPCNDPFNFPLSHSLSDSCTNLPPIPNVHRTPSLRMRAYKLRKAKEDFLANGPGGPPLVLHPPTASENGENSNKNSLKRKESSIKINLKLAQNLQKLNTIADEEDNQGTGQMLRSDQVENDPTKRLSTLSDTSEKPKKPSIARQESMLKKSMSAGMLNVVPRGKMAGKDKKASKPPESPSRLLAAPFINFAKKIMGKPKKQESQLSTVGALCKQSLMVDVAPANPAPVQPSPETPSPRSQRTRSCPTTPTMDHRSRKFSNPWNTKNKAKK